MSPTKQVLFEMTMGLNELFETNDSTDVETSAFFETSDDLENRDSYSGDSNSEGAESDNEEIFFSNQAKANDF